MSKTGLEKFRRVVEIFRGLGLVTSNTNPDRDAIRCGLYHSRFLYDFMTDSTVLKYFSRVAGIELIPLPIHWSQIQINLIPAYNPDAQEPGFGTHVDSTNFACILCLTRDRNMEGGALQHALMNRKQFFGLTETEDNIANAEMHMVLPDEELMTTYFIEEGSAVFQQGVLVPHQVENVQKSGRHPGHRRLHISPGKPHGTPARFFLHRFHLSSRDMQADIGKLLVDSPERESIP